MPRRSASSFSSFLPVKAENTGRTLSAINLALPPALLLPALVLHAAEAAPNPERASTESEIAADIRLAQSQADEPADLVSANLRFGRHEDYDRFAFEWSTPVEVETFKSATELVITFDRAAETASPPDSAFTYRRDRLPQIVFGLRAEDQGRRYRIDIDPDARFRVHRWKGGRLIVVDVFQPASSNAPGLTTDAPSDEATEPESESDEQADQAAVTGEPPITAPVEEEALDVREGDNVEEADDDLAETEAEAEDDDDEEEEDDAPEDDFQTVGEFVLAIGASLQFGVATAEDERLSDGEGDRGYTFFTDNDIEIEAYTTILDNTDIGAFISLEADADVSDETANADETYLYFDNGFGYVELGRTSGAEDDMALGADTIAAGTGGIDGDGSNLGDTQVDTSGDAAKITYYTPRVGGFQAGASYTPDTGDEENDDDSGFDLEDHVGVGLNFVEAFGDVELSLATVGSFGGSEFSSADDLSAFSVGGTLTFDQVELGASYGLTASDDDFDFATLGVTVGFDTFDAGFGYNFLDEKFGGETHVFVVSGDTPILPGVELQGDVSYANPEDESSNVASVLAIEMSY